MSHLLLHYQVQMTESEPVSHLLLQYTKKKLTCTSKRA